MRWAGKETVGLAAGGEGLFNYHPGWLSMMVADTAKARRILDAEAKQGRPTQGRERPTIRITESGPLK